MGGLNVTDSTALKHSKTKECGPKGFSLNPFTASACKISGLNDAQTHLQTAILFSPMTHLASMLCVLMKTLSHVSAKRRQKGQRISKVLFK